MKRSRVTSSQVPWLALVVAALWSTLPLKAQDEPAPVPDVEEPPPSAPGVDGGVAPAPNQDEESPTEPAPVVPVVPADPGPPEAQTEVPVERPADPAPTDPPPASEVPTAPSPEPAPEPDPADEGVEAREDEAPPVDGGSEGAAPVFLESDALAIEGEQSFDIEDLSLEDLLEGPVSVATGTVQRTEDAPAVVTVITRQEIRQAGYRTVAEALEMVPGFAVNTDHVFYNVGVRGISGGIRGGSRHLKVLIDGVPVAFLPDAWNFLGPEFLPMSAIERIEVVRGPASALYGANAFLGVVNVVTRDPDGSGGRGVAVGEAGIVSSNAMYGGEGLLSADEELIDVMIAARSLRIDRSGLDLPGSSPNFTLFSDPEGDDDVSRPLSVFGRVQVPLNELGSLKLTAGYQRLDARGEYVDTGALSRQTRVQLDNYYARLSHEITRDNLGLRTYLGAAGGGPGDEDRILPVIDGQPANQLVRRDFGYRALNVGVEPRFEFSESQIKVGFEYQHDREELRTNIFESRGTGATLNGPEFGHENFDEYGVYGQFLIGELDAVKFSGNVRFDSNNQFGDNFNYRAGAVWSATEQFYFKALSGSSFRGPTPEQFYATPTRPGGIQGSRSAADPFGLRPQRAFTQEIVAGYRTQDLSVIVNGYLTDVNNRIEYLPRDGNLQVDNLSTSRTIGVEASARWRARDLFEMLDLNAVLQGSFQSTDFDLTETVTPRERELFEINEIFPRWTLAWMINAALPQYHVNVNIRMPILGERQESQTNQLIGRPFEGDSFRVIRESFPFHIVVSSADLKLFGERETRVQLAAYDLFNSAADDPGFNGINVPALGRRVFLTVSQELQ